MKVSKMLNLHHSTLLMLLHSRCQSSGFNGDGGRGAAPVKPKAWFTICRKGVVLNFASDEFIESMQNFSICRWNATRRNAGIEFESIPAIGCVAASVNACVARPLRHIVNQA